jgi:hypothetical protein
MHKVRFIGRCTIAGRVHRPVVRLGEIGTSIIFLTSISGRKRAHIFTFGGELGIIVSLLKKVTQSRRTKSQGSGGYERISTESNHALRLSRLCVFALN